MHQIKKINVLANSGIKFFTMFTGKYTLIKSKRSWFWVLGLCGPIFNPENPVLKSVFLDTMKEPDGSWPEEFDDLLIRPFLMATFHTARLYSKFISIKRTDRIEWTKKSWDYYKLIIDIYETRKNAKSAIKELIWMSQ